MVGSEAGLAVVIAGLAERTEPMWHAMEAPP
jgi:hypothetical protein